MNEAGKELAGRVLDPDQAPALTGGDKGLTQALYRVFLEASERKAGLIAEALASGDVHLASVHAHALKGAAANVGAERTRAAALVLELSARRGDLAGADAAFEVLRAELSRAREAVSRALAE